ncbi:hypothetical protein ACFOU2_22465 [Bacillus songklensis]|uniref:Lipoprotein n=1 Tax=Bacillus songklensis TaxID=1069116 RepID=A0ABV8B6Y9_9BACI
MKIYTSAAVMFIAFMFLSGYALAGYALAESASDNYAKELKRESKAQLNLDLNGYKAFSPKQLQHTQESPLPETETESLLQLINWQCQQKTSCPEETIVFLKDAEGYIIQREHSGHLTATPIGKIEGEWLLKHTSLRM